MMISEYLQRDYVLRKASTQRDGLERLARAARAGNAAALRRIEAHHLTVEQVEGVAAALTEAVQRAQTDAPPHDGGPYIPSSAVLCALQAGWTQEALSRQIVEPVPLATPAPAFQPLMEAWDAAPGTTAPAIGAVEDASPRLRLAPPPVPPPAGDSSAEERIPPAPLMEAEAISTGDYVENSDIFYGLDGLWAKLGRVFHGPRAFNHNAARIAASAEPLRLYLFGDWGTGLPLAQAVTNQIARQIRASGDGCQQHVVHLGDVYYVGNPDEYANHMLAENLWPVAAGQQDSVGSWSLNGNHDMYSGGHGYFDTLLRDARFARWQTDAIDGSPSSFFLIEDAHWQIFGLDTSWLLPPLANTLLGENSWQDYAGQNGALEQGQVEWMQEKRNPAKGCVLLTHHQPASSRSNESQHSDDAVARLRAAGLYHQLDAWVWGHEHRGVVFKPRSERTDPRLKDAPPFCACLGHGGVPVPGDNFDSAHRKPDVEWEENRLGPDSPLYEGKPIVPLGFAVLDSLPETIAFKMFDHRGENRGVWTIRRRAALPLAVQF